MCCCTRRGLRAFAREASIARAAQQPLTSTDRTGSRSRHSERIPFGRLDEQGNRLEDGVFDHRFQWNGALYQENWNNVQIGFFDPGETGNLAFGTNGQDFRIRGVETSIVARVLPGLTLQGAASWNSKRADQLAGADRHQSGQRELRQGNY